MKKYLKVLLVALLSVLGWSHTVWASTQPVTIEIGAPKAPPVIPILRMIQTKALGDQVQLHINWWRNPQSLIAMVQNKQAQVYAFPLTVLSKLYNKGLDVQLLNVNTWGVEAFLSTDPSVKTWADLKGKTIYVPLKSSPPDVFTQFFLKKAGLTIGKDVHIVYAQRQQLANLLITGQAHYATLIEPLVTIVTAKNPKVKVAFRFDTFWHQEVNPNTNLATAGIGALGQFTKQHPELASRFNKAYAQALDWVVKHPQEAGELAQQYMGMNAKVVAKAIPHMGLSYLPANKAQAALQDYWKILYDFNPVTIGGHIPNAGMYFAH